VGHSHPGRQIAALRWPSGSTLGYGYRNRKLQIGPVPAAPDDAGAQARPSTSWYQDQQTGRRGGYGSDSMPIDLWTCGDAP